ncbi:MAG: nodulation protein NfeD [Anaerolineales bacterium]
MGRTCMRGVLGGLVLAGAMLASLAGPGSAQATGSVWVLTVRGPLTPALAEYLDRGLESARRNAAQAVVLKLDTPGGSIDVMNRMVQSIRASEIPVIVYVAPDGAIAGSAGTVIVLAGHLAAMAPQTALGAASPVGSQGEDLGQTLEAKVKEILKATVRTLAEGRGQAAIDLAEASVEEARAATSREALEAGLIDVVASDIPSLLDQVDGRSVRMGGGEHILHTRGAAIVGTPQTWIEQFLHTLTNPNIVFLLLTLGVQAILIELSSPGGWVSGFVGVVCLALGAYGLGILPVNWFGLVFLATAFILFILEVKAPTHGALSAAGLAAFVVGALVLFNSPGVPDFQRVSVPLVIAVGLATAGLLFIVIGFAIRAQRRPVTVGGIALVGRTGEARTALSPSGMVQVAGELWSAELAPEAAPVAAGELVEVVAMDGLRLRVRPAPGRSA